MTRKPVRRVGLPTDPHKAVDRTYSLQDFVDRARRPRFKPRAMVPHWPIYERAIDLVRETIAVTSGEELADDPQLIVDMLLPVLSKDAVLFEYIHGECGQNNLAASEWKLIHEAFGHRLLGRYNREISVDGGSDE